MDKGYRSIGDVLIQLMPCYHVSTNTTVPEGGGRRTMALVYVHCPECQSIDVVQYGKQANGTQRYRCNNRDCPRTIFLLQYLKTDVQTHKTAHVVLFSSDLTLGYAQLIDYYRLRFQLEFNFRDAKQYWGLEDFMSINERPVYNSANLS